MFELLVPVFAIGPAIAYVRQTSLFRVVAIQRAFSDGVALHDTGIEVKRVALRAGGEPIEMPRPQ